MKKNLLTGMMLLGTLFFAGHNSYSQIVLQAEGATGWTENFGPFADNGDLVAPAATGWNDGTSGSTNPVTYRKADNSTGSCNTATRARYIPISNITTATVGSALSGGTSIADGIYNVSVVYVDVNSALGRTDAVFMVGPTSLASSLTEPITNPGGMDTYTTFFTENTGSSSGTKFFADATNVNINAATDALYIVICPTHSSGNLVIDRIEFTYVGPLATIDASFNAGINMFPNPTSKNVTIESNGMDLSGAKVKISNAYGVSVLEADYTAELNVSTLKAGIYSVMITKNDKTAVKQLVIE